MDPYGSPQPTPQTSRQQRLTTGGFQACLQVEGSLKIQNSSNLQFHGCHNNVSNGGGARDAFFVRKRWVKRGGEDEDGVEKNGGG